MDSWILNGINYMISRATVTGYLHFMCGLFVLSLSITFLWYLRARIAHRIIISFFESSLTNEDSNQRYNIIYKFNEWLKQLPSFRKKIIYRELREACNHYFDQFQQFQKSGEPLLPDIYDFFLEDNLVHKYGKRKLVEATPGIFVSVGILGTFIGLIAGLDGLTGPSGQFVSNDSEAILGGIGSLISGMSLAFYTSISGIILSLFWQLLDKTLLYPFLVNSFHLLRNRLDYILPTQVEESFLQQLVRNQEQQIVEFRTIMSEQLIPQMIGGLKDVAQNTFEPYLKQTDEMIREVLEKSSQHQLNGMQEMVNYFIESLQGVAGEQMKRLSHTLEKTVEWQEKVYREMTHLVASLAQAAQEQAVMVEKTTLLTEQIHQYTERLTDYHETLQTTLRELNETTDRNKDLQESISLLLDKMTTERQTFDEVFEKHMEQLTRNVEEITLQGEKQTHLLTQYNHILDQMNGQLELIYSNATATEQLAATLTNQLRQAIEMNETVKILLAEFKASGEQYQHLQDQMTAILTRVQEERDRMDQMSQEILNHVEQQMTHLDERMDNLKQVWIRTNETLEATNQHLSTAMKQFAEHMYQGLERTFDQFDRELSKAVQHLQSGIQMMGDVLMDLPDNIEKLGQYIHRLNEQAEKMMDQIQ